jgi:hypothetical protein
MLVHLQGQEQGSSPGKPLLLHQFLHGPTNQTHLLDDLLLLNQEGTDNAARGIARVGRLDTGVDQSRHP